MTPRPPSHDLSAAVPTEDPLPWWRWACRVLAAAYLGLVLAAVLWPSGADVAGVKRSLGPWFLTEEQADVLLNLAMLAPLTLLAALGWTRVPWWRWAVAGCAVGVGAELTQWALPALHRRPSVLNALCNGTGAWAGAAVGLWALRWTQWRSARRATAD